MERIAYDEFGLFHENASEYGLAWTGPPIVRREEVAVERRPDGQRAGVGRRATPSSCSLHGGGQNAHTWDTVALALGRPLVAVDLPGHGHSTWRDDPGYSPRERSPTTSPSPIERSPRTPRLVVGMSLGGMTSIGWPPRRPTSCAGCVLVDVTPGVNREKAKAITDFVDGPQSFAELRRPPGAHDGAQPDAHRVVAAARHPAQRPTSSTTALGVALRPQRRRRSPQRRGRRRPGGSRPACLALWDDVGALALPLLLVRGSVSPVVDDDDVAELLARQPSAEVVVVDGAGHSVQGDRPVELAAPPRRLRARLTAAAPRLPYSARGSDPNPDRDTLVRMYELQSLIKQNDERFRSMLMAGQISLIYYSPRGQECISAGYAVHLRPDDQIVATYRGLHDHWPRACRCGSCGPSSLARRRARARARAGRCTSPTRPRA